MSEKRTMTIEIHADTTAFTNEVRAAVQGVGGRAVVPVGMPASVPAVGVGVVPGAGMFSATEHAAVAAAMSQAQANAAPYAMPGAMGMPLGSASPNWSYLLAQQQQQQQQTFPVQLSPMLNPGAAAASSRGAGSRFSFMGVRSAIPVYAAVEAMRWGSSMRETDLNSRLADSDTEAFSARAESPLGSGVFGSIFSGVSNVAGEFGFGGSADALRAAARVEAKRRGNLDSAQASLYSRQYGDRLRSAETGGTDFDVSRARAENQFEKSYRSAEAAEREARRHLGSRPFKMFGMFETNWVEYDEPDAGARQGYQTTADSAVADKAAALADRNVDLFRIGRAERLDVRDQEDALGRAKLMANRASERTLDRFDLDRGFRKRLAGLKPGDSAGFNRLVDEAGYARTAQTNAWDDADRQDTAGYNLGAQIANLRAAGNFSMAQSIGILQRAGQQVSAHWGGLNLDMLQSIGSEALAQLGEVGVAQARHRGAFSRQLNVQTNVTTALVNRDPLGARLAGIEGARQEALSDPRIKEATDPDGTRRQINQNFDRQKAITTRQFADERSDTARAIGGETERAMLGINGGPTRFIRQGISSILQSADLDVRHLEDAGDTGNAMGRRELTRLQLRGAESEFYRSIQYREASPRGVVGTGTLEGVRGAFSAAENQVSDLGRGAGGNGTEGVGGWTPQKVDELLNSIRRILANGAGATVG